MAGAYEKYQWNYKIIREPVPVSDGEIRELEKKLTDLGSRYWEVISINHMENSPYMLIYLKNAKWRTVVTKDY